MVILTGLMNNDLIIQVMVYNNKYKINKKLSSYINIIILKTLNVIIMSDLI